MEPEMPFPQMPQHRQLTQSVPDHEVLLVFTSDEDAARFRDWLQDSGWPSFGSWVDGHP